MDNYTFRDEGSLVQTSSHVDGYTIVLDFDLHTDYDTTQTWSITANNVFNYQILEYDPISNLAKPDHPVLAAHLTHNSQIHITSAPANPYGTYGQLLQAQFSVMGDFFPANQFLLSGLSYSPVQVLTAGAGQLANGPEVLIQKFREILDQNEVGYELKDLGSGMGWFGYTWGNQIPDIQALVGRRSFILAKQFTAARTHK